jgi:hypothetical protein
MTRLALLVGLLIVVTAIVPLPAVVPLFASVVTAPILVACSRALICGADEQPHALFGANPFRAPPASFFA